MLKIALMESQYEYELPHLGMCLLLGDLKARDDVQVEAVRVDLANIGSALDFLTAGHFDLVAIDCRFPLDFPMQVKERSPQTLFVVGGLGFYNMLTKGRADFAIQGPGRRSFSRLIDVLAGRNGASLSDVPNLFYWQNRPTGPSEAEPGIIDYSGVDADYDLQAELEPFRPEFDFPPLDSQRAEKEAEYHVVAPPAIVAEFGCPHKKYRLADSFPSPVLEAQEACFTDRGMEKLSSYMLQRWQGGCSFCVYQQAPLLSVDKTVETLIRQAGYLQEKHGFKSFAVQSESPFRFLIPFLTRLIESDLTVQEVFLRGRASAFFRRSDLLEKAVSMARENGFGLVTWQIGYESFSQSQLDLYNKGTAVKENLAVVRLTRDLTLKYPGFFRDLNVTHGMILFNPWTTFEDFKENYSILAEHLPERLVQTPVLGSELELFDPFLPIYQKARDDGLVVKKDQGIDTFRMADPRMEIVRRVIKELLALMHELIPPQVRMEVRLLASVIRKLFGSVIEGLEARYFLKEDSSPGHPVSWLEEECRKFVDHYAPRFREELARRVDYIQAVREIRFFGSRINMNGGTEGESPPEEMTHPRELEISIADLVRAQDKLVGRWDLDLVDLGEKVIVVDKSTGDRKPMDRVEFAFIQITLNRMDLGGILREVLLDPPAPPGLLLERARRALAFLESSAVD